MDAINSAFKFMLDWIYSWVGNYGWSVVIFTLFIRMVLLPLDIKSKKGMRAMNRVQPKMQELQKKYANDKDKLNQKTMELYKKENISPMAGCLPMLLQFPILIFMFTAMRVVANEHTIQMILDLKAGLPIQLESWLWIKNVFQPDSFSASILPAVGSELLEITSVGYSSILTSENIEIAKTFLSSPEYAAIAASYGTGEFYSLSLNLLLFAPSLLIPNSLESLMNNANGLFILPILAGVSQFIMNAVMNGTGEKKTEMEKIAEKQNGNSNPMSSGFMKWFFPIFSVWICATSNAAFSIYWMAVNVIQIVQQYVVNYILDRQDAKKAAAAENKNN